jgi:hypothetical protein
VVKRIDSKYARETIPVSGHAVGKIIVVRTISAISLNHHGAINPGFLHQREQILRRQVANPSAQRTPGYPPRIFRLVRRHDMNVSFDNRHAFPHRSFEV